MAVSKQWTRLRTLGRGASGAEVFLAADDVSGELFAVKSATAACASALKREEGLMSCLRSPRVVSCIGGRGAGDGDGSYQLFLEFAPGGSLADRVASNGGLNERAVRGYAADVAAGLAYVHGAGMVHGDVKARNVVIGADGRAKLADFGCARKVGAGVPIIGGTPAFMAPEVARGEEQGPAADVWALGCTVVEMATGRAPWTGMDGNALAALHRIGYTETVPEVPQWLSAEAKDFLRGCLVRRASERCTAAQLLEHPFLASAVVDAKPQAMESKWVSPKSTLDAAFWESDSDTEEPMDDSTAERRIRALACPASALPEWDSDEGWIDVLSAPTEAPDAAAVPAKETTGIIVDDAITSEEESVDAESGFPDIAVDVEHSSFLDAGEAYAANPVGSSTSSDQFLKDLVSCRLVSCKLLLEQTVLFCNIIINAIDFVPTRTVFLLPLFHRSYLCSPLQVIDRQIRRKIKSQIQTVTSSTSRGRDSDGGKGIQRGVRACAPHRRTLTLPPRKGSGQTRKAQRHCRRTARMHRRHKVPPHGQKPLVIRLRGSSRVDGRRAKASQVSVPSRDCFARWRFIQRRAPSSDGVLTPRTGTRRLAVHLWMACRLCAGAVFFFFLVGVPARSAMHVSRPMRTGRPVLICFSVELVHTAHGTQSTRPNTM